MDGAQYDEYIARCESGGVQGGMGRRERGACRPPGPLYTQVITDNFVKGKHEDRASSMARMMKGFAILELVCINLFLYPWRKEIRTLKKFTGNFVYFVEPVIPEKIVMHTLQRVGYSIVKETEYIIGGTINIEEAKRTAFDLYLARLYCEELLGVINENKSDQVSALSSESSLDGKGNADLCTVSDRQTVNTEQGHGKYSNIDREAKKATTVFGLNTTPACIHDEFTVVDSHYCYSRPLDSDEFLNKYSDLNLAQQPILPRKTNSKPQEMREERLHWVSEEATFHKPYIPESFSKESEQDLFQNKPGTKIPQSESELSVSDTQRQPERLVIKLKMGNMADEALTYPIEETVPPEFSNSDLLPKDSKWTFPQNKVITEEGTRSPSFLCSFSMMNVTPTKATEWGDSVDHIHKLREPPSSMYIPPGGSERQCVKITNLQPEENQAPSPPGDMVVVSETLFKVNEDTKEDFVMITRKEHLKN